MAHSMDRSNIVRSVLNVFTALTRRWRWIEWSVVICVCLGGVLPLVIAIQRLLEVTGGKLGSHFWLFFENQILVDTLIFSFEQAVFSTCLTVIVGLPLAWMLGRYSWKHENLIQAILFIPFITPPIVAAVGFYWLLGPSGPLSYVGMNLLVSELRIPILSMIWEEQNGALLCLFIAHAWFNISLLIRYIQPAVRHLDRSWEEQMLMLPQGDSTTHLMKQFWWPILRGPIFVASTYVFFFCFTSFALVRWLTPFASTLESTMAELGGSAGIAGYRLDVSSSVLSIALIQGSFMLFALAIAASIERRMTRQQPYSHHPNQLQSPQTCHSVFVGVVTVFTLLPLISIIIGSFRLNHNGNTSFTLEGWKQLFSGDVATSSFFEAGFASLSYAILTALVAVPFALVIAGMLNRYARSHRFQRALFVDLICLTPLSLSAVLIGLGILIGIIRLNPHALNQMWMPVVPHILLVLPFLIRLFEPAMQRIDSAYEDQASMLPKDAFQRWWLAKGNFLVAPTMMATSLCLAFSLGEFGATYLMLRVGSWDSLSILVDELMARPKFDPLAMTTAYAAATSLMALTFASLMFNEFLKMKSRRKYHD